MNGSATTEIEPREAHGTDAQWSPAIPFRSQWEVQALRGVFQAETLPANWDSYGSRPPTPGAINRSRNLLRRISELGFEDLPVPFIVPVPGGGIQIEWSLGGRELEFEILPEGSIEYLRAEGREFVEQAPLGPGQIHSLLAWLLSAR